MKIYYDRGYDYGGDVPLLPPEVHGFLRDKPTRIRQRLLASGEVRQADFLAPDAVAFEDLAAVHTPGVLERLSTPAGVAEAIELPVLASLPMALLRTLVIEPQLRAAGGTCAALAAAAEGEWTFNLSGGFHHARPDRSHGFCLLNDVALAVHCLRARDPRPRILVLDLDLHQGDGNAAALAGDADVFTASMHEEDAFPFPKARSDLDLGLAGGVGDEEYLAQLERLLSRIVDRVRPEVLVYVAGSDPYVEDPLGSLRLTREGLLERDRRVAAFAIEAGAALVALPAGGYTKASPEITADGYVAMMRVRRGESREG